MSAAAPEPPAPAASAAPEVGRAARDLLHGSSLTGKRAQEHSLRREFSFESGTIDKASRTVALSFSSEAPVLRSDFAGRQFWEVLDHKHVDMSRMRDGGGTPLLYGHDRRDHLGTVTAAAISPDKVGRAIVKFSRSTFAQEKFQDVEDGILTRTSVGYDLGAADYVADGEREGIPVYRFRNWQPYEVTLTPIPADPSVGVGRSQPQESTAAAAPAPAITQPALTSRTMSAPATTESTSKPVDHLARQKEIRDSAAVLFARHPQHKDAIRTLAEKCMFDTGDDVGAFQRSVLNDILGTAQTAAPVRQVSSELGLSGKEQKRYSMLRAISLLANGRPLDGLEREASDAEAKRVGRDASGFFVPSEIFAAKRDLAVTGASGASNGGYLVGSTIDTANMVELLRNSSEVIGLGARTITGLVGDVSIPRVLTGATCYWVSENGTITSGAATFGQIAMKPRRIGASVPYSKQFLAQSSIDAESFVRDDIMAAMGTELDRVAINGAGGAEPLGILNLATADRATSVTFGAAPTWAKVVAFETNVATANANKLGGTYAYLTTPAVKGAWKTTAKVANQAVFLWENGDIVNGYPARATNQFPSGDKVIHGNFGQVVYGEWAGIDVTVDAITLATTAQVKVTIQKLVDMIIRQGKGFSISTDSGAQ